MRLMKLLLNIYRINLLFLLILFLTFSSCKSNSSFKEKDEESDLFFITDKCKYMKFPGSAEIVSFDIQNVSDIKIVFNFNPDISDQKEQYRFPHFPDKDRTKIIKISQQNPESWIKDFELKPGNKIYCIRCEILSGTCSPVIYLFPDINVS